MAELSRWVLIAFATILAIFGLIWASNADDDAMFIAGLALFVFGIGLDFRLIAITVGRRQDQEGAG